MTQYCHRVKSITGLPPLIRGGTHIEMGEHYTICMLSNINAAFHRESRVLAYARFHGILSSNSLTSVSLAMVSRYQTRDDKAVLRSPVSR